MRWRWSLFVLILSGTPGLTQEALQKIPEPLETPPGIVEDGQGANAAPVVADMCCCTDASGGFLTGNRNFQNFIGFLSNPLQNIDPRAVTSIWPIFGSSWVSTIPAIPNGDIQLYGAGLNVALSDRLSIGMNQGGYAVSHFKKAREGWLNLGGFVQYTLIEDVPNQFLLTAGLRWEAPSGSKSVFQGKGPAYLAPYVTVGKEFAGVYHVLATVGYTFPAGSGNVTNEFFYANAHFDRQFGCFYPLVEFNWTYHTSNVDVNLPTQTGYIDLGNFTSTGNILTMAVGANIVLIPNRLEMGGVYMTSLAAQRDFEQNGLLVKMVYRY